MIDNPMSDPLPSAHPVPGGRPPLADGHTIPCPVRPAAPPVSRRQRAYGLICAGIVLALLVVGIMW